MNREETYKEALEFLRDELRLLSLRKLEQQAHWRRAREEIQTASAGIKFWQFWRHIQQFVAAQDMSRADTVLRKIVLKEMGIQRVMVIFKNGYAPDERILEIFQEIANEAHLANRRIVGVAGIESKRISERSRRVNHLVNELRAQYRATYGRRAA